MNGKYMIRASRPETIMSNPDSLHGYFGWPSVARLNNGDIAAVASGFRLEHVCPFGKAVMSVSRNEGKTFCAPHPVIDTPLDDRDAGITVFGENGVIVTTFNNTVDFQRGANPDNDYIRAYLDTVKPEDEKKYLGSLYRVSFDGGVTFGELHHAPVTSPHGVTALPDGGLLWIGRIFNSRDSFSEGEQGVACCKITPDGKTEIIGRIKDVTGKLCEPHTVVLPDGTLVCHMRDDCEFTIYQSVSSDGGKSWSEPIRLLPPHGGAPAHLMLHSSGVLVSVYGYREKPYGIRAMFSEDNGKSWDTGYTLYENPYDDDLGYPASVELEDGKLLTVFYAHDSFDGPAVIMKIEWSFQ